MMKTNWFDVITSGSSTVEVPAGETLVNRGVLGAASIDNTSTLQVDVAGAFQNDRLVAASVGGTVVLDGINGTNNGIMESMAGGRLQIEEATVNKGRISANHSVVTVENTVTQQGRGEIDVSNSGTLDVTGSIAGGTINIDAGTLKLDGPAPLHGLAATVDFTGQTGTIDFGGTGLIENYSTALHSLAVDVTYASGETAHAEIALPATGYSATNFDVVDNKLVYTADPTQTS